MKIDLKWFLPLAGPFMLLGAARLFWFVAGAEWSDPQAAAGVCFLFGITVGFLAMAKLYSDGVDWTVHIGRGDDA